MDRGARAFLDGTAAGVLLLRRCLRCGEVAAPDVSLCPACRHPDAERVPACGRGLLVGWSAVPGRRDVDGGPPARVVAIAELEEGPWWWADLEGADREELWTGAPVTLAWRAAEFGMVPVLRLGPAHPNPADP